MQIFLRFFFIFFHFFAFLGNFEHEMSRIYTKNGRVLTTRTAPD